MWHVGLDAHWKQSTFCVLDENGQKIRSRTIRGGWQKVLKELESLEEPFAVCFEASTGYGFLFEQLNRIARQVVVAHDPPPLVVPLLMLEQEPFSSGGAERNPVKTAEPFRAPAAGIPAHCVA